VAGERGDVVQAAQLERRARELYRAIPRDELSRPTLELLAAFPLAHTDNEQD
jgi:hypothetical protein